MFRLVLAPVQYAAYMQDNLRRHLEESLREVTSENLIPPAPSLVLPICEQLKFHKEGLLADLYVNLLSCSMDKERVSIAHPGFINVIAQLAPDEARLLDQLPAPEGKIYVRGGKKAGSPYSPLKAERLELYENSVYDQPIVERLEQNVVKPDLLGAPSLFLTYLEHLVSLGVVEYMDGDNVYRLAGVTQRVLHFETFPIRLSKYGRLFYSACMKDRSFGSAYD